MFKKTLNTFIICVFFTVILLPLITADYQGGKISVAENRYLAPFPKFIQDGKLVMGPDSFDNWINDNIGGRKIATQIQTNLTYKLFGTSAKSDTLIGKDDWTYYYTKDILRDYTGDNLLPGEELVHISDQLSIIEDYVKEKGSFFRFIIVPDKKTIYPENYPDGIKRETENTRTKQLVQYLGDEKNIDIYTLESILNASKNNGDLYSPRLDNAHWNELGAYIGYEYMMRDLCDAGLNIPWVPLAQCTITEAAVDGLFNDSLPMTETGYTVSNDQSQSFELELEYFDQYPFLTFNNDPSIYKKFYINQHSEYPSLLFVGDSYSQKLFQYLPQSFSRVMFLHSADLPFLPDILDHDHFDAVMVESAERMLDYEFSLIDSCVDRIRQRNMTHVEWSGYEELPVRDSGNIYQYLDYIADTLSKGNTIFLDVGQDRSYAEGWAIDAINGTVASEIILQVGDQYYRADYGKERQSVVDAFGNDAYLNSGYTILLDTAEILSAGEIAIHVISADGTYRYPPVIYHVDGAATEDKSSKKDLPVLDYTADMGYQFLDLCGEQAVTADTISVDTENTECYIEGWAVDPIHGGTAGNVVIRVGEHDYTATYGKPRQGVAEIYGSDDYLNCGYSVVLNTQEVLEAGEISVHVIASDGAGQYPPVTYRAEPLQK